MRNTWLVFRRDVQHLFGNVISIIITVGLVVLPSLFSWYNILACWDVFNNTGNLSVAVANDDAGYEGDLIPVEVNVGDRVVAALRENDQINWVFTTSDDAIEGTSAGDYYAALVIPEDFSENMLTFYESTAGPARIDYYVNEKKNAIAPNIIGTGADTVSREVNETFAQAVSETSLVVSRVITEYAREDDNGEHLNALLERMRGMADHLDQTADVLGLYSSLATESKGVVQGGADLVGSARVSANDLLSAAEAGKTDLKALVKTVSDSASDLSALLKDCKEALQGLKGNVGGLLDGSGDDAGSIAADLNDLSSRIDKRAEKCLATAASLQKVRNALPTDRALVLDRVIEGLEEASGVMKGASGDLSSAADALDAGVSDAQEKSASFAGSVEEARASIEEAEAAIDENLKPGVKQLKADAESLSASLDQVSGDLATLGAGLPEAVDAAADALDTASGKVDGAAAKLHTGATGIRELADAAESALNSGDVDTLRSLLEGEPDELAGALAAPVQVERTALYPCDSFGSAMTPLYTTLALFIGSLLIMVAMKPEVSQRGREELSNPKPRQLFFGRFGAVAVVSLMQTTLMGLGEMLFLRVQVVNPLLFMLCFWVSGLVFAFIVYTLVVSFGNLGKGIAVLMLIVQVTGCGGSYPLQVLPDFVQQISPFLPATHVVNAMRSAMMGVYQGDYWVSMASLLTFVVPFLLLGLVLRKPLAGFMRWYVSKVEESGLME